MREADVLAETLDVMRQHDAKTDAERVQTMIDAAAAGGRAVVGADATLYVAFDSRATALPPWLDDGTWTLTSLYLDATDTGTSTLARKVYSKQVPAGTVMLGGNLAPRAYGHYVVIAKAR